MPEPTSYRLITRAGRTGGVRWAVVAGNGRTLGMAAQPAPDARVATMDFLALCPVLSTAQVSFGRELRAREWRWQVGDVESGHLAVSAQAYERHATARAAFARFVVAATEVCAGLSG